MPTYDYVCQTCAHEMEAFQPMAAAPLTLCPQCQGSLKRKFGAGGGIIFKGTGYYVTDNKKSPPSGKEST